MKILVSAGHSTVPPIDPGAVANGYKEAVLALELRDLIIDELKKLGIEALTDGEKGVNKPLKDALQIAKQNNLEVEIHFNAGPPAANGTECLCKIHQKNIAQSLCSAISKVSGIKLRGELGYKASNSGQHHRLAFVEAGGVILEVCFITSKLDMSLYQKAKLNIAKSLAISLVALSSP